MMKFRLKNLALSALLLTGCTAKARLDLSEYEQQTRLKAPEAAAEYSPPQVPSATPETRAWNVQRSTPETEPSRTVFIVRQGDTIYSIAKQHNVTVASIFAENGLLNDRLTPGQHLVITTRKDPG